MKGDPRPRRQALRGLMPLLSLLLLVFLGFCVAQECPRLDGPGRESPNRAVDPRATDLTATSQPGGIQENWFAIASRNIETLEYHASMSERGLQAPNRGQNLRTYFRDGGIEIIPRAQREPAWRWTWRTHAFGRDGSTEIVEPCHPSHDGAMVTYDHGALTEWYQNDRDGLEQGFSLKNPPPGSGRLWIEGSIGGDLAAESAALGQAISHIDFKDADGRRVLRYGKLTAYDASGRELPGEMLLACGSIRILVNDHDAVYPVEIDPLLETPEWYFDGDYPFANVGRVHTAGDVNGDGYSDVVISASGYDDDEYNEGRVWVFHGSSAGLSEVPDWWADGDCDTAQFGRTAVTAGDVNGDGFHDLMIGAPGYDNGDGTHGRVYVYHGSSSGLSETHDWVVQSTTPSIAAWSFFGSSASTAGDVNGDGFDDVLIGHYMFTDDQPNEGRVWLYFGSADGLESSPAWITDGNQNSCSYGGSISTAGDVNADGYTDILVGASRFNDRGRAFLFLGSAAGPSTTPDWFADGERVDDLFGRVAGAGDVDGDGYGDVVIGARHFEDGEEDEGRAYLFRGNPSGLELTPAWWDDGDNVEATFGACVATAGDVNGDGLSDVIIGATWYAGDLDDDGRVFVYYGSRNGLSPDPVWQVGSGQTDSMFGNHVATAGDVNGDGFSDILVGAGQYDGDHENGGRAFLYLGSGDGPRTAAGWVIASNQGEAHFGTVASAGDVDGDGCDDVIVGAPGYDNGQADEGVAFLFMGTINGLSAVPNWYAESNQSDSDFGSAVSSAGDVNGDGYSDVLVGARCYDGEGRAFLWLGSASGGPMGNPANAAWSAGGGQAGADFGHSVASAGDVNGDGYSDVIVGAPGYANGQPAEGLAAVYVGSESGLNSLAAWSYEGVQAFANLGVSVASAGDANGDGYSDVLAGAPLCNNGETDEGIAYLFDGSSDGLEPSWSWFAQGNQAHAQFGFSVASAGDVNADGYSDIVIGAPLYDFLVDDEGLACVWFGGPDGPSGNDPDDRDWGVSAPDPDTQMGYSVSSAGDVNGDGFSDLLVGGPYGPDQDTGTMQVGVVTVWPGCADGVGPDCGGFGTWEVGGSQDLAKFGVSVASADVNGDGFSDILVGATDYTQNHNQEGRAYLYYGNDSRGLARSPGQMLTDHSAPIGLLGISDADNSFGLRALGRTARGRGEVHMEWEVKRLGTPFDFTGIETGTVHDTGVPVDNVGSAVLLSEIVTGLVGERTYHWRLRIASHDPYFPRTPWFSPPGNGAGEMDLRTPYGPSGAPDIASGQDGLRLESYPNPFLTRSTIRFSLLEPADVQVRIYDVHGRRVRMLVDEHKDAGVHQVLWDGLGDGGRRVASGVYWIKLTSGGMEANRQLLVMR